MFPDPEANPVAPSASAAVQVSEDQTRPAWCQLTDTPLAAAGPLFSTTTV